MICIYISDDKIKLIDGAVKGGAISVKSSYDITTNAGSMETGNIKDLVVFAQILQDCLTTNKIKADKVTFILDNSRIVFREMIVPDVPESKIRLIIQSEIFSDSKVQNTIIDYVVVAKFKEDKKPKLKIRVTYITNDCVESLLNSATELGLTPTVLDIAPNAMSKLIWKYSKSDKKALEDTFLLLDYKDSFITISVFDKFNCEFTKSTVLYAGESGEVDKEYLLQELVNNVNSVVRFYGSRTDKDIKAIYITGNASDLEDILQDFADAVNMLVSHLPLPSFIKGMSLMDFNSFSCALGAFIRR